LLRSLSAPHLDDTPALQHACWWCLPSWNLLQIATKQGELETFRKAALQAAASS
jgi:hypothetical protein